MIPLIRIRQSKMQGLESAFCDHVLGRSTSGWDTKYEARVRSYGLIHVLRLHESHTVGIR